MKHQHRLTTARTALIVLSGCALSALGFGQNAAVNRATTVRAAERTLTFESGTVVRLGRDARGETYSIQTADGRASGVRAIDPRIRLAHRSFDPLTESVARAFVPSAGRLRLIQYETQPLEEYERALTSLGVRVHRFVPEQTVIANVPADAEDEVRGLPFVRWMGPFAADDRLAPALLARLQKRVSIARDEYTIQLMRKGTGDTAEVERAVLAFGGSLENTSPQGYLLRATLSADAVQRVAALDEVLWIERSAAPQPASGAAPVDKVRVDGGMDVLEQRTGFTGLGVRGEVFDEGMQLTHPDFQHHPPILHGLNHPRTGHGTGTHGAVFGDGATDLRARAMLPEGQSVFASFRRFTDRYVHTAELLLPPYEVVFQTNSWGNGPSSPGYPSLSFEMDDLIHTYDLLTCQAFGNAGRRFAFRQAWAKNVVTVGGITHFNTLSTDDDVWGGKASAGPATDNRIKPDLSYWNDRIYSTKPGNKHGNIGGTSASTPLVAGHFGVFYQMWHEEVFGNVALGTDIFTSRPRSSTARALLFNTAQPYDFSAPTDDLARSTQGWGRPNVERLHDIRDNALIIDEWNPIQNMEWVGYTVFVEEGQTHLNATLVYTDLPGNTGAAIHRINDLTLRVTAPSGTFYWGNNGLSSGNLSTPGGSPNRRDTVEQVWLADPEPGRWLVQVIGAAVVSDAHLATPEVDAAFSLVVAPIRSIVTDLGRGVAPPERDRAPTLEARGSFVPGSPWRFDVSDADAGERAFLVIGERLVRGDGLGAPFGQSVSDVLRVMPMAVDDTGSASVAGVFARFASARRFYAQVWTRRGKALAASNVLAIQPSELPTVRDR